MSKATIAGASAGLTLTFCVAAWAAGAAEPPPGEDGRAGGSSAPATPAAAAKGNRLAALDERRAPDSAGVLFVDGAPAPESVARASAAGGDARITDIQRSTPKADRLASLSAQRPPVPATSATDMKAWDTAVEATPPAAGGTPKDAAFHPPGAAPADDTPPGEIMWSTPPGGGGGGAAKTASLSPGSLGLPGRPVELEAPVKDGKFHLGDVAVRIAGNDVSIPKTRLLEVLKPILRAPAYDSLNAIAEDGGYVHLAALSAQHFDIQFDPGQVELQINPTIEQRAQGKLSAGSKREQVTSENLAKPAIYAGFLNIRAGADYTTTTAFETEGTSAARADFEGAMRWFNVVMESRAALESDGTLSRRGTRFVYDMPEDALRITAGDVDPLKTSYQGGSDLLGVTIEKSYQKLQPGQSIHPTGSHGFRIERPSDVDVVINGHVTQRLQLRPGDYDINDLPLTAGANDISLIITDDVGNKRTMAFTVFSGRSLLAPGVSEWALSGGVASRYNTTEAPGITNGFSQLEYDFGSPMLTGYYQRGLTDDLTGEAHLQADTGVLMGGAGAFFQTAFGFFGADTALSHAFDSGPGIAAHITYDLANIEGADGIKRSFRFASEYRSENFAVVDVIDPHNETMLNFSTSYSQELPWKLSGSLSASYSIIRDGDDHYGADLNLARSFGPSLSTGLSVGYDHSATPSTESRLPEGMKAMLRLNYRVSEHASLDASHDARDGRSQVSYRYQEGTGVGAWNAQAEIEHEGGSVDGQDNIGLNGALGYTGNRAEVAVSQHTGFVGFEGDTSGQRTSVTAGTAVAFADGAVAVGRPVSNSFAIVEPHANLPDSKVTVGSSKDAARASSGMLGPALLPDLSAYSPSRVPIDVENLPVGYDLGAGGFDLYAPYKSGYRFTIGSDYTVTAFGALVDDVGEPVALLTGEAFEEGHPTEHRVTVFTNKAGRFGAQGLRPGRWVIEMATEPKSRFVFDVPKDTVGLLRLDPLKPVKNGT